jgi:two-component system OmpR family response regulator
VSQKVAYESQEVVIVERSVKPGINQNGFEKASILLLERERSLRKVIAMSLEHLDIRVLEAGNAEQARSCIEDQAPDIFILDLDFPEGKDGELIQFYRKKNDGEKGVVFVTTTERPEDRWRLLYQPDAILYKPLDVRYLIQKLQASL